MQETPTAEVEQEVEYDPEREAWEAALARGERPRRRLMLKIRIETIPDREEHALQLVAQAMKKSRRPDLPLIPLADQAHMLLPCFMCGVTKVWVSQASVNTQAAMCETCRLEALDEKQSLKAKLESMFS